MASVDVEGPKQDKANPQTTRKCRILEILHYTCPAEPDEYGRPRYSCYPIPRIFNTQMVVRCEGIPAVEITKAVSIDPGTGEVTIPPAAEKRIPKAKLWRDVRQNASAGGAAEATITEARSP
ncbi:hypothetical protein PENSPDRAFT_660896 [Peniophora sp. CONT]|nr:hypothetical protein PENSPDRAFT_660896 [Peniophora sp. CONT]